MQHMALLAEGILKLHWDQTVPVNIPHIVKSMGVRLSLEDSVPCSARLSITAGNQAQLQLSRQLPHLHQRYVVAHALAHVALHHLRPGMQRELHLSEDFRLDFGVPHNLEANDFALRLLMPEPALRYAVEQMQARSMGELEHVFAVPALFIKQRLSDLGMELPRAQPRARRSTRPPVQDV
jgi:hypothetical protein